MIMIQIILILAVFGALLFTLFGRQSSSKHAWKKIMFVLLAILMIFAVAFPEVTTDLAHLLGVGRGADLLLYFITVGFIWAALNGYMHKQRERDLLYRLARRVSLIEAFNKYSVEK